jgi:hypothetical protein
MVAFRLVIFGNVEVYYELTGQWQCSVFRFLRGKSKRLKDKEASSCVAIKVSNRFYLHWLKSGRQGLFR